MKNEKKNPAVSITRSVVLPVDIDGRLQRLSAQEDRTLSYLIAKAVREFVERAEKKEGGK